MKNDGLSFATFKRLGVTVDKVRSEEVDMLTLRDVTGRESGAVMWDKEPIMVLNWMGIEGIPRAGSIGGHSEDLVSMVEEVATQDLTKDELANLSTEGKGASISGVWRIGGAIVVTFEGWP